LYFVFVSLDSLDSMKLYHDEETLDQIGGYSAMNSARAARQSWMTMPPLGVTALDNTGLSTALLAGTMLGSREESSISSPEISRHWLVSIVCRNVTPSQLEHRIGSITDSKAKNMLDQAGDSNPEPERGSQSDAKLIELDDILLRSSDGGKPVFLYAGCVFFRMARTVFLEILKVRAMLT
jgi:hypothetical protein